MVEDAVVALNEMYCGDTPAGGGILAPTAAQSAAFREIEACARRMGPPPPGVNGQGALRARLSKYGCTPLSRRPLLRSMYTC